MFIYTIMEGKSAQKLETPLPDSQHYYVYITNNLTV